MADTETGKSFLLLILKVGVLMMTGKWQILKPENLFCSWSWKWVCWWLGNGRYWNQKNLFLLICLKQQTVQKSLLSVRQTWLAWLFLIQLLNSHNYNCLIMVHLFLSPSLADTRWTKFNMKSLDVQKRMPHSIWQNDHIFDDVALYRNSTKNILHEFPFHIRYIDRRVCDIGGVAHMFSAFWEVAYIRAFEGGIVLSCNSFSYGYYDNLSCIGYVLLYLTVIFLLGLYQSA